MKKFTEFGKMLRHHMIEAEETYDDLANVLVCSKAFVSTVVRGKRNVPNYWCDLIAKHYHLDEKAKSELIIAAERSGTTFKIRLGDASFVKRCMAYDFMKYFPELTDEQAIEIAWIVYGCKKEDETK